MRSRAVAPSGGARAECPISARTPTRAGVLGPTEATRRGDPAQPFGDAWTVAHLVAASSSSGGRAPPSGVGRAPRARAACASSSAARRTMWLNLRLIVVLRVARGRAEQAAESRRRRRCTAVRSPGAGAPSRPPSPRVSVRSPRAATVAPSPRATAARGRVPVSGVLRVGSVGGRARHACPRQARIVPEFMHIRAVRSASGAGAGAPLANVCPPFGTTSTRSRAVRIVDLEVRELARAPRSSLADRVSDVTRIPVGALASSPVVVLRGASAASFRGRRRVRECPRNTGSFAIVSNA